MKQLSKTVLGVQKLFNQNRHLAKERRRIPICLCCCEILEISEEFCYWNGLTEDAFGNPPSWIVSELAIFGERPVAGLVFLSPQAKLHAVITFKKQNSKTYQI